jgi:hypothetical protein
MKLENANPSIKIVSTLIFLTGALIGILFLGGATWADFEASLFSSGLGAEQTLSVRCPVMIAPDETGVMRAAVANRTDKTRIRRVQTHISAGYVTYMDEYLENLELEPGDTRTLKWEFTAENAAWDRFVLARVTLFSSYPLPAQTGTCGVQVVNIFGLPGGLVTALACILSLGLMIAGIFLRRNIDAPSAKRLLDAQNLMLTMAGLVTAGILAVLAGVWLAGGLALIGAILLNLVAAAQFLTYTK